MRIVVPDASALLDYLLGTARAERVRRVVRLPDVDLHVPSLCDVEIVSGLRRAVAKESVPALRAAEALQDYIDMPLGRHAHGSLLTRMFELRENFSAYDAAYVALAEAIGADLMTSDGRLARAAAAHTALTLIP